MHVAMMVPDEGGCGHYRVRYPGRAAAATGVEVEFRHDLKVTLRGIRPVAVTGLDGVDVVVMQRPLRRVNVALIPVLQRQGIAVVVDVDDDFTCVDPDNVAWGRVQPHLSPESNAKHLASACRKADLVTVTTPALARRYGHGRVAVLPNYVPAGMLGTVPMVPRDGRTVGWPGFVSTHPHDLEVTHGGVARAVKEAGARFLCVGTGEWVQAQLHLGAAEFAATGSVAFDLYPHEVARLDVGIAPLKPTKFNEAKSGLKLLEMAAVGVPCVGSPCPDYERLAADGIGVLAADRGRDWRRQVKRLLGPEGSEVAERGRHAVRQRHTYEAHALDWVDAWERAIATRRANLP